MVLFTLFSTLNLSQASSKKGHWTDFVPNQNLHIYGKNAKFQQHPSHSFLNEQSRRRYLQGKGINVDSDIPFGHTKRKELNLISKERNKVEDRVNGGLIGGIVLRKGNERVSKSLINYAYEQRQKSRNIQYSYIQKVQEGQVDVKAAFEQEDKALERKRNRFRRKYEKKKQQIKRERVKKPKSEVSVSLARWDLNLSPPKGES